MVEHLSQKVDVKCKEADKEVGKANLCGKSLL